MSPVRERSSCTFLRHTSSSSSLAAIYNRRVCQHYMGRASCPKIHSDPTKQAVIYHFGEAILDTWHTMTTTPSQMPAIFLTNSACSAIAPPKVPEAMTAQRPATLATTLCANSSRSSGASCGIRLIIIIEYHSVVGSGVQLPSREQKELTWYISLDKQLANRPVHPEAMYHSIRATRPSRSPW